MSTTQLTLRLRSEEVEVWRHTRELESDYALAKAMGISQGSLSRTLRGKQRPGPRFIAGLCTALNAPFATLFEITEDAAA